MATTPRKVWKGSYWLVLSKTDIETEYKQCKEEGKDLSSVENEFKTVLESDLTQEDNLQRAEALLERTVDLPTASGFPYHEPSDLDSIRAKRPSPLPLPEAKLDDDTFYEKALGGWLGRSSGCLLGKPVECRRSWQIEKYLKAQNRWPLDRYFSSTADPEIAKECGFDLNNKGLYEEGITCMVEDDDTNYTATGLAIVKKYGKNFTPEDVMSFWLENIPLFHVCTAERVAYRNFANSVIPPESASFRNPYREWIGAQIRADFFGYVNPGNPELAADYAWRDACISHVKNGIYGEMWVAAMLAAAYVSDDLETVIRAGLAQIPAKTRLTSAVEHIIGLWKSGKTYDEAVADMKTRWNEDIGHDWCHTISNAELVVIALLWGNKDFEKTICLSVMPGFDTDCNGATAGSVLGVILGAKALPKKWIAPLNDTLLTGVAGYYKVSLSEMARETVELALKA